MCILNKTKEYKVYFLDKETKKWYPWISEGSYEAAKFDADHLMKKDWVVKVKIVGEG